MILTVMLVMAAFGSLQIGLLDPICLMYRTMATVVAPATDMAISEISVTAGSIGIDTKPLDDMKFAPGVDSRVFVGSFWIGIMILALVGMNVVIPRFFCRVLCPLGAFMGVLSRFAIFRINRDVHKCTDCNLCLTRCEGAADPMGQVRLSEMFRVHELH